MSKFDDLIPGDVLGDAHYLRGNLAHLVRERAGEVEVGDMIRIEGVETGKILDAILVGATGDKTFRGTNKLIYVVGQRTGLGQKLVGWSYDNTSLGFAYIGEPQTPSEHDDLAALICDIGAENDDYARIVIPLIKRMLADDYSQTGLFGEIASALDRVEKGEMTLCAHEYSPEAKCGLSKGHAGNHEATVEDRDPETRLLLGTRNIQWPNV